MTNGYKIQKYKFWVYLRNRFQRVRLQEDEVGCIGACASPAVRDIYLLPPDRVGFCLASLALILLFQT